MDGMSGVEILVDQYVALCEPEEYHKIQIFATGLMG